MDPLPPATASQPGDRQLLAGEWEYADGAVVRLTLDEQGNGHYDWEDGRFETLTLIGHTWHGMWFQKENDRDGGFPLGDVTSSASSGWSIAVPERLTIVVSPAV